MSADYECETCHRPGDEHTAMCANYDALQARVRELEAQLEMREQQAIVREPLIVGQQERIAQLEQDNAALRAELAHSREREEMHSQLRQDNHQEMLRLESENIALREQVGIIRLLLSSASDRLNEGHSTEYKSGYLGACYDLKQALGDSREE